jgi:choline dehydrogenase-like flavoprotein
MSKDSLSTDSIQTDSIYINTGNAKQQQTYDAIVIGSGISGGFAAKESCEKGLKTLVIERGRKVEHITDYPTAMLNPWQFENRLKMTNEDIQKQAIQSSVCDESNKHFFVNDLENPYIQEKPFSWIRGYQTGGRSLTWGRQCYRLGDLDFEANAKDGIGVDWPVRYKDIAPWYDYAEQFVGVSGKAEGLKQLPDGVFLDPMEMNCIEQHLAASNQKHFPDRVITIARVANLTKGLKGRGPCQFRNLCARGCPFSGYFSSNSASLPAAFATGNLSLLNDAIVKEVLIDDKTGKAIGVRVIDANTKEETEFYSKIIFINASTINTTAILLQSVSNRHANGLGNSSGMVGKNLMDHPYGGGAYGEHDDFKDKYYQGRRPTGVYIPRFQNIEGDKISRNYKRGFGYQGDGERAEWPDRMKMEGGFGKDFKEKLTTPGPWTFWMISRGECLPYETNQVSLDKEQKDQWGLPIVRINFEFGENEKAMVEDQKNHGMEMLEKAGFKNIRSFYYNTVGGRAVHEMGTARMGNDPKTSVVNGNNQLHEVPNVYITDGSFMTSSSCINPSLTYLAFTARACEHAVNELKKGAV